MAADAAALRRECAPSAHFLQGGNMIDQEGYVYHIKDETFEKV